MVEHLWAPWRITYIETGGKVEGCIFCVLPEQNKDSENLILYRGKTAFAMMNTYPYNNGHLMVAPFKHTADMYELTDEEILEVNYLIRYFIRVLGEAMHPNGYNLGVNLGKVAGAGVEDHIHWHIVPRWNGDTNFMPVIADIKVMPESLQSTYDKLKKAMETIGEP